jgi:hypothetical protein
MGEGITGTAAEVMRPITSSVAAEDTHYKHIPELGEEHYPSFLAIPLLARGATAGVLVLQRGEANAFTTAEVALSTAIATTFAYALEAARGDTTDTAPRSARLVGRPLVRGARAEGEVKDFRAGRCMGACLEYASRANGGLGVPLMMYVFSDGSLSSNGVIDDSTDGRGKGEWTSDNSSTAASFFLIYNPNGRAQLFQSGLDGLTAAQHQQLGYFSTGGDVVRSGTPGANNVNLLVEMVLLNYMALHNEQGLFATNNFFPSHGMGDNTNIDRLTAFEPICNGVISNPI